MQVVLQGSLQYLPPAEFLSFLCARDREGTLDIECAGKRLRIAFVNDRIIGAESSSGLEGKPAALEALSCSEGTFTLLDSAVVADTQPPLSLDYAALLEEARLRAIEGPYADDTVLRIVDDPPPGEQVSFTGVTFKLLFRLAGGKKFGALVKELGLERKELTSRLQQLEQLGLITAEPAQTLPQTAAETHTVSSNRPPLGSLTPDDHPNDVYPLLDVECTIGRSESNTIALPDASVSSSHARVVRTDSGFVLEDLASRNGTFVNGDRISEKRPLLDGDLIRFGKVIMLFNVAREARKPDETLPPRPS
jgi:hypothetical protein